MRHMIIPQDVSREPKYQNIKIDMYKKNQTTYLGTNFRHRCTLDRRDMFAMNTPICNTTSVYIFVC